MTPSESILIGALVGDALCLGSHWIYSQREIDQKFGAISGYAAPATSYHPGKQAGDLTHYGDQTMILLRSLAKHGWFSPAAFAGDWRAYWEAPDTSSYRDGATRSTLLNLQRGVSADKAASSSNDLAGAARIAPLFLLKWNSTEQLLAAARQQTALTHDDPSVIESAEFFARVTLTVQSGVSVTEALREVASLGHWQAIPSEWIAAARATHESSMTDAEAGKELGLTCHVPDAFPLICHLLFRHPSDGATALRVNAQIGGDNAARGMILGMIYGAQPGADPLPPEWVSGLRAAAEIQQLVHQIAAHD
jgi:ADP-ribosylglycohydrolase